MAKFSKITLTKKEQEEILISFCQALVEIKKPEEGANFIQDLLSKQEALMLAKRLMIAKLLIKGVTYDYIRDVLKVGPSTIARVNAWLLESGQGYRTIIERLEKSRVEEISQALPWRVRRRRATLYNWPQELLEEIILSADKHQRERIIGALDKINVKSALYKELSSLLRKNNG